MELHWKRKWNAKLNLSGLDEFLKMGGPEDAKGQKKTPIRGSGRFARNCFGKCPCGFGSKP